MASSGRAADLSVNYNHTYSRFYWIVDPDTNYITGRVTHYFAPLVSNLDVLEFELGPTLTVDSVLYHKDTLHFTRNNYLLSIKLPAKVQSAVDSVTICYHGKPTTGQGAFEQGYHSTGPIIWTLSEPYGSKDWWPCKQSLTDKIDSIDVYIEVPSSCKAASNGSLVSVSDVDSHHVFHWKHRYPIAAYLVALAVTNYTEITSYAHYKGDSVLILNYIYPEDSAYYSSAIERTVPIMEVYMNSFGKYPFFSEKYGHAEFGRNGGMEHQTMGFMGFFNDMLIGHEMAHQWFGDKVTCGSWADIWLNESFATYAEEVTYEYLYPKQDMINWRKNNIKRITDDPGGSVYIYGNDTNNVGRVFDHRLTYLKGGMVLQMLRLLVGDSAFFTGIQNYLNDPKIAYGYAKTADFQKHMEASSGKDLTKFISDWIYQEGYPSYTVTWRQTANWMSINISQQQSHSSVYYFDLPVPLLLKMNGKDSLIVLYNNKNDQNFSFKINNKVDSIIFDPESILISRNNKVVEMHTQVDSIFNYITIFPNPFNYGFTIYNSSPSESIQRVQIFSENGKLIDERNFNSYTVNRFTDIITTITQTGMYIVKVSTKSRTFVFSMIKGVD